METWIHVIKAIMVYTKNGLLAYDAKMEMCDVNFDLVAAFVTAMNEFGCELFPGDSLNDILFTHTHLCFERHGIASTELKYLVIHDPFEDHEQIYRIIAKLHGEIESKYEDAFIGTSVISADLAPLDDFVCKLFEEEGRAENPFSCGID